MLTSFPSFLKSVRVVSLEKYSDMFHQLPLVLRKLKEEEDALTGLVKDLRTKLDDVVADLGKVVARTNQVMQAYQQMGTTFNLPYQEGFVCSWKNLRDVLGTVHSQVEDVGAFLKQPVFEFIKLHGDQTDSLLEFVAKNQRVKQDLTAIKKQISIKGFEKADEITADATKLSCYLNHISHLQFKSFFLLKSRNMMTRLGRETEAHLGRLGTVD